MNGTKKKVAPKVASAPSKKKNEQPPPSFSPSNPHFHFTSTADPCVLCQQSKEKHQRKILPLNCNNKHTAIVCIPCFKQHLAVRCKNNQLLICPVVECGSEIVAKDIDALKNIGACDESLQYKMHIEKLKMESRKITVQS